MFATNTTPGIGTPNTNTTPETPSTIRLPPQPKPILPMNDIIASVHPLFQCRLRARQLLRFHARSNHTWVGLICQTDLDLAKKLEPDLDPNVSLVDRGEADWPKDWETSLQAFTGALNWLTMRARTCLPKK